MIGMRAGLYNKLMMVYSVKSNLITLPTINLTTTTRKPLTIHMFILVYSSIMSLKTTLTTLTKPISNYPSTNLATPLIVK